MSIAVTLRQTGAPSMRLRRRRWARFARRGSRNDSARDGTRLQCAPVCPVDEHHHVELARMWRVAVGPNQAKRRSPRSIRTPRLAAGIRRASGEIGPP